ncbi:alpha/beta hydrolase [Jiangella aurantiaca]|uniref:Alpha/beta hydrolase n=1 Tax=Jiangella aurantiaca TaxID=2530373 RepID=A0A4R5AGX4_9ACTN|nr:alpha/beta hydrolase [Jiangella aurantiaca]TDD69292.1 alpha/beta hydrolase [Jiangella aurantiaca]
MRPVGVGEVTLAVWDEGTGKPVVFVQTALTADELRPLSHALRPSFRTVLYHRRGYGRSSPTSGPGSIRRDAADCVRLLDALEIARAHVVGVSYSAAVALQLAADAPGRVLSIVLIEPPPVHVASAPDFRAANERLIRTRRLHGARAALDEFLILVIGSSWRADVTRRLPGAAVQMERDASTFFDTDLPAVLSWSFGPAEVARVRCPVLHVAGSESGPWFAEVRAQVLEWFPSAGDVVVPGADHSLAMTHWRQVAAAVEPFLLAVS